MDDHPEPPATIRNPLHPEGAREPIAQVLSQLASQEGRDGEPYDQMVAAARRLEWLEARRHEVQEQAASVLKRLWSVRHQEIDALPDVHPRYMGHDDAARAVRAVELEQALVDLEALLWGHDQPFPHLPRSLAMSDQTLQIREEGGLFKVVTDGCASWWYRQVRLYENASDDPRALPWHIDHGGTRLYFEDHEAAKATIDRHLDRR